MVDSVGWLSLITFGWLTKEIISQFIPLIRALRAASRMVRPDLADSVLPEVRVLLCLKGTDPFLDRCLKGLATQNYLKYRVTIVLDSIQDDAVPQVRDSQSIYGPELIQIIYREHLFSTCSRRASSLITALEQLEDEVKIVVLCDGDCVPHENWLRDLVRPLIEDGMRATSGNRWYVPKTHDPGTTARYFWNAMAAPRMYQEGIIWAGSMALRHEVFRDPDFMDSMRHAFSEDTKTAEYLRVKGGILAVPQPDIPVINSESTTLSAFWGFLVRQMLAARLHHQCWPRVFRSAMMLLFSTSLLFPLAVARGRSALVPWVVGFLVYGIFVHLCVGLCEWYIRVFIHRTRKQHLAPYTLGRVLMCVPGATVLSFLYPFAVLVAAMATTHVWRGVTYRIVNDGIVLVDQSPPAAEIDVVAESL